ncbi:acyl-CoA N-acyltransferase [Aspergillus heteromorphus CBS 117.55]|uniref:Acyl-CoA N-acyltransferase n=1 Tax=Aspergillus heteromorphus CBS 117.55 TaxID=1448321 RepID=A0A317WS51_9EURO|nr:acyl-CoA N-acyltransferase [Aspergillus heteromorphus CBS 117.55]PWY89199.1 acyl-CoA N-acyltransferase [Aspergillus heteromorphus CBS 117.55]
MLTLTPCTPTDAPALATLHTTCFSSPFEQRVWPPVPEMHAWWTAVFAQRLRSPRTCFMKVVDSERGDEMVGFGEWGVPDPVHSGSTASSPGSGGSGSGSNSGGSWEGGDGHDDAGNGIEDPQDQVKQGDEEEEEEYPPLPACADAELFGTMIADLKGKMQQIMGGRGFWYISLLATNPQYRRRGIASTLMQWGMQEADAAGMEMFVVSSPMARGVYMKYGFELAVEGEGVEGEGVEGMRPWFMVRKARG